MTSDPGFRPDPATLRAALMAVMDPEAGMNIVDLGLVYDIRVAVDAVEVDLTMTTPSCPMSSMIAGQAREALAPHLPVGTSVIVNLVWEPPWNPSRMSPRAREHFGWK